jgi:hypothetical protein
VKRSSAIGWAAIDLAAALILVVYVLIAPPARARPTAPDLGYYAVQMTTPVGRLDDVDLYVRDPDGNVAYFDAMNVGLMTLEHDVIPGATETLGATRGDDCDCERTILRGVVPGTYVVNVHMYNSVDGRPDPVTVTLWSMASGRPITSTTVTLRANGDVATPFRFTLGPAGNVVRVDRLPDDIVYSTGTQ